MMHKILKRNLKELKVVTNFTNCVKTWSQLRLRLEVVRRVAQMVQVSKHQVQCEEAPDGFHLVYPSLLCGDDHRNELMSQLLSEFVKSVKDIA